MKRAKVGLKRTHKRRKGASFKFVGSDCRLGTDFWTPPITIVIQIGAKRNMYQQRTLDPLMVANGVEAFVNPDELPDYLRPPECRFPG